MKRTLVILLLSSSVLYVGDYLAVRFRIPRSHAAFGVVKVQTTYAVKQKDGKTEFYFNPPENHVCVHSLFSHMGYTPCWYLSRKSKQQISM